MPKIVPSVHDLNRLVTPDVLAGRGFRKPTKVVVREGSDSTGHDAYYVWVIYPDNIPQKDLALRQTAPLQDWIEAELSKAVGDDAYTYVMIKQASHAPSYI